jgi:hypothetical protein
MLQRIASQSMSTSKVHTIRDGSANTHDKAAMRQHVGPHTSAQSPLPNIQTDHSFGRAHEKEGNVDQPSMSNDTGRLASQIPNDAAQFAIQISHGSTSSYDPRGTHAHGRTAKTKKFIEEESNANSNGGERGEHNTLLFFLICLSVAIVWLIAMNRSDENAQVPLNYWDEQGNVGMS